MPVPPNSSEHEAHAKGEDPTGGDPEFKPKKGTTTGTGELLCIVAHILAQDCMLILYPCRSCVTAESTSK